MKTSASVIVNAPVQQTFDYFTDFDKLPQILHDAHFVEFKSPNRQGIGAKWEQRSGELENPTIAFHEITTYQEPNSFTMISLDSAAEETLEFKFQPKGENQTEVTMSIDAKTIGCLTAILAPLLKGSIQQSMTADLTKMKDYIETQV